MTIEIVHPPGRMGAVPNQPKTPVTNFRIPLALKAKAQRKAEGQGRTLTDVVVEALEEYTHDGADGSQHT